MNDNDVLNLLNNLEPKLYYNPTKNDYESYKSWMEKLNKEIENINNIITKHNFKITLNKINFNQNPDYNYSISSLSLNNKMDNTDKTIYINFTSSFTMSGLSYGGSNKKQKKGKSKRKTKKSKKTKRKYSLAK